MLFFYLKNIFYLIIFRERAREGEREKHQLVAFRMPLTGDLTCNPGMCPDWESNWWPFGLWACTQSNELHQPGLMLFFLKWILFPGMLRDVSKLSLLFSWYIFSTPNTILTMIVAWYCVLFYNCGSASSLFLFFKVSTSFVYFSQRYLRIILWSSEKGSIEISIETALLYRSVHCNLMSLI